MSDLTPLEQAVISKLLEGDSENLSILRKQVERIEETRREFTGCGFFTTFKIANDAPQIPGSRSFNFGDIDAEIPGVELGVGFLLWVRNGVIDFLEGYTSGDAAWPTAISSFELRYLNRGERNPEPWNRRIP